MAARISAVSNNCTDLARLIRLIPLIMRPIPHSHSARLVRSDRLCYCPLDMRIIADLTSLAITNIHRWGNKS